MAEPPVVVFGIAAPAGPRGRAWWAMLPSRQMLYAGRLGDLLGEVERAMAQSEPNRPFSFRLKQTGRHLPGYRIAPASPGPPPDPVPTA